MNKNTIQKHYCKNIFVTKPPISDLFSHKIICLLIASQALLMCSRTKVSFFLFFPIVSGRHKLISFKCDKQINSIRTAPVKLCTSYPTTLLGCHQFTQIRLFSKILPEEYFSVKKPRKPKIPISTQKKLQQNPKNSQNPSRFYLTRKHCLSKNS